MLLPGELKRNKYVIVKDMGKMYVADVDKQGNNADNPLHRNAVYVTKEEGSSDGSWVPTELIQKYVGKEDNPVTVVDQEPLTWSRYNNKSAMQEADTGTFSLVNLIPPTDFDSDAENDSNTIGRQGNYTKPNKAISSPEVNFKESLSLTRILSGVLSHFE